MSSGDNSWLQAGCEGQLTQHDLGLHDVLVDLEAFFLGQGAVTHPQVVQLALVVQQLGLGHAETPAGTRCR